MLFPLASTNLLFFSFRTRSLPCPFYSRSFRKRFFHLFMCHCRTILQIILSTVRFFSPRPWSCIRQTISKLMRFFVCFLMIQMFYFWLACQSIYLDEVDSVSKSLIVASETLKRVVLYQSFVRHLLAQPVINARFHLKISGSSFFFTFKAPGHIIANISSKFTFCSHSLDS